MKNIKLKVITLAVLFCVASQNQVFALNSKEQAQDYRQKGYYVQQVGDINSAIELYLKAISLDSDFAACYNDLGIAYESVDELDLAEESYKRCIETDENYLPAYANLALLYEGRNQLKSAAFFWKKRVDLGRPGDYWTIKARNKLNRLTTYLPEIKDMIVKEETSDLAREVRNQKVAEHNEKLSKAKEHFELGKQYFVLERYAKAKDEFQKALLLKPNDPGMLEYYKKAKDNEEAEQIKFHSQEGLKYYERGDLRQAREHFEDLLTVIPEESNH